MHTTIDIGPERPTPRVVYTIHYTARDRLRAAWNTAVAWVSNRRQIRALRWNRVVKRDRRVWCTPGLRDSLPLLNGRPASEVGTEAGVDAAAIFSAFGWGWLSGWELDADGKIVIDKARRRVKRCRRFGRVELRGK